MAFFAQASSSFHMSNSFQLNYVLNAVMLSAVMPTIMMQNVVAFFAHTSFSFQAKNCGFEINYVLNAECHDAHYHDAKCCSMLSAVIPSITIQNAMGFFAQASAGFQASYCGFHLNNVLNAVMLSAIMPSIMMQNVVVFLLRPIIVYKHQIVVFN